MIVGSAGMLGEGFSHIIPNLTNDYIRTHYKKRSNYNSIKLDIRDKDHVTELLKKTDSDVVINCSSITNPEECEKDPDNAYATNVTGTQNLAEVCNANNIHFVQISTEYVFDGKKGPYKITDDATPLSIYGKTKLESEKITVKINPNFCIARTAMLFGWCKNKINLATFLISNLRARKKTKVINDQFVSPSYNDNVAEMLNELAEKKISGIWHIAGSSVCTRYDFAINLAEIFNLDKSLIEEISISQMPWTVQRPIHCGLVVDKTLTLSHKPMTMEQSIKRMKNEEKLL